MAQTQTIPGLPMQQISDLETRVTTLEGGGSSTPPGAPPDLVVNSITVDGTTTPCIVLKGTQNDWTIALDDTNDQLIIQATGGGIPFSVSPTHVSFPMMVSADPMTAGQLWYDPSNQNVVRMSSATSKGATMKANEHKKVSEHHK